MKALQRWAAGLAAALLLLCLAVPSAGAAAGRKVIRVGYPIQQGLTEVDENGERSGYTYEYLREVAQFTGWEYEFVEVEGTLDESLVALMGMVERGEIDLLGSMTYSEGLAETFDYVDQSYGQAYTVLYALEDNTSLTTDNYVGLQGMRVAALEQAKTRQRELETFCTANEIDYQMVFCADEADSLAALEDGRADVMLGVDVAPLEGVRPVARFAARPFYFVTTKGNTALARQLSSAIVTLSETDPYYTTTLYERYFGQKKRGLILSDSDRAYIAQAGTLRVGFALDKPPFSSMEGEDLAGIAPELMSYIGEATGLQFEYVPVETEEALLEMLRDDQVDLMAAMSGDYKLAQAYDAVMTRSYVSSQYVLLLGPGVQSDSLAGKRLAVRRVTTYDGYFVGNVQWYGSAMECIDAVNGGDADYTYMDGYTTQYYLNQPKYKNISMVPQSYESHKICIGVARPVDPRLLTLLNKVLISLPEETLQAIVYRNTTYRQDYSLLELIESDPAVAAGAALVLAAAVILVLVRMLYVRSRRSREAALELKRHYQIYELSNEIFFEYDFRKGALTISDKRTGKGVQVYRETDVAAVQEGPEDEEARGAFWDSLKNWRDGVRDLRCRIPDGTYRWLRITARRVCDENGVPVYVVGKLSDIDEEKREREELVEQARKDGLTQVYNAAVSRDLIASRVAGGGSRGALFIVDVDHFKDVNDRCGHYTGDQVLRELAEVLRALFRSEDIVGRLGGDEFVVYMHQAPDRAAVERRCKALLDRVRKITLTGGEGKLAVSLGVAFTEPGMDYDTLYQKADAALYEAKKSGRDRASIAE